MIKASYQELVKLIANSTKLDTAEIERKVQEKKAKLSDLISLEGAAQIVAAELGVSFDQQKVKVDGLLIGMRKVSLVGKIMRIYPIRSFTTKNGTAGKVANLILSDDIGNIKCVLWDTKLIQPLEEGKIKEGDVVELSGGNVRQGQFDKELHLGSFSAFKLSTQVISNAVQFNPAAKTPAVSRKISELTENERAAVRAVVVQAFEPKFFSVCPECGKKPLTEGNKSNCAQHGVIIPKEKSLMSVVLDDGTGNMRSVCFNEVICKIFKINETEVRGLIDRKNEILGRELVFSGRVRKNKMFDNLEFIVSDIEEVDPEKLIGELNNK
ncbi:OB-fold nucleic acid binding domain-containing protein [Nanoarchaeota archaeon]